MSEATCEDLRCAIEAWRSSYHEVNDERMRLKADNEMLNAVTVTVKNENKLMREILREFRDKAIRIIGYP